MVCVRERERASGPHERANFTRNWLSQRTDLTRNWLRERESGVDEESVTSLERNGVDEVIS